MLVCEIQNCGHGGFNDSGSSFQFYGANNLLIKQEEYNIHKLYPKP